MAITRGYNTNNSCSSGRGNGNGGDGDDDHCFLGDSTVQSQLPQEETRKMTARS